jgi:hypothetical protein
MKKTIIAIAILSLTGTASATWGGDDITNNYDNRSYNTTNNKGGQGGKGGSANAGAAAGAVAGAAAGANASNTNLIGVGVGVKSTNRNNNSNANFNSLGVSNRNANVGINGQSQTLRNKNDLSNRNSNSQGQSLYNANSAIGVGGTAKQGQLQGQGQDQGQSQTATTGDQANSQSTSISYTEAKQDYSNTYEDYTPSAAGYAADPTATCIVTYGGGIGVPGFSGSVSGYAVDEVCQRLELVRSARGDQSAAVRQKASLIIEMMLDEELAEMDEDEEFQAAESGAYGKAEQPSKDNAWAMLDI